MPYHYFTVGGSVVKGFRVSSQGEVLDFEGTLRNNYDSLSRATASARRKYSDPSINITETVSDKKRYRVDLEELLEIAELIEE